MAQVGAILPLVALLTSGTPVAKENAAAALQRLADDEDSQGRVRRKGSSLVFSSQPRISYLGPKAVDLGPYLRRPTVPFL